ncbi:alpha/beta hydrolase fold domain-containing protein [Geodermatophilus sp. FMUSA9-8]|uniref:alpha/beta hydrolase fold domain-containing protein n=1 Tax=Geodermatophilus sp. FMUSA9-8 TaxID=3120155 RepID=UPI003008DE70
MTLTPDRTSAPLPGRLGDPAAEYRTDDRADRRLRETLARYGLDAQAAPPPFGPEAPLEDKLVFVRGAHDGFEGLYAAVAAEETHRDDVTRTVHAAPGRDGHDVPLYVFRPAGVEGPLPGVVYIHGGGMTILDCDNRLHTRWCEDLAAEGLVVVAVDFRNAVTATGHAPFPAGLHDCADALTWLDAHRDELGATSLVLQGESGGANLCLASALLAKREGRLDAIAGVYAMVPYISGAYGWDDDAKRAELPSLVENEGWFLNTLMMAMLVSTYDPSGEHTRDPLAWPYFASVEDLTGMPPHVVSVNELDPLRDEGIAYYRKLQAAGVRAVGRVDLGLTHGADSIFKTAVRDVYDATVADIARFARSVAPA